MTGPDVLQVRAPGINFNLPGHTLGHTGYYCERLRLLFSADLFSSYREIPRFPPAIFNSAPVLMQGSVARALELDLTGVLPNHCDRSTAQVHLERLRRLNRPETRA